MVNGYKFNSEPTFVLISIPKISELQILNIAILQEIFKKEERNVAAWVGRGANEKQQGIAADSVASTQRTRSHYGRRIRQFSLQ